MEIKSSTSQPPVISPEKTPLLTALASDEMVSNNIRVGHVLFPATVLAKTRTCSLNMLTKVTNQLNRRKNRYNKQCFKRWLSSSLF